MRVIAGMHKGRSLQAPKGRDTRPTADRVRESLFSALASARGGFEGACVLDAFAGSGALGVEALSRGASFACFCERGRDALSALAANTSFLEEGSYAIARIDCERQLPSRAPWPFDLLLFDPPYAWDLERVAALAKRLQDAGLVAPSSLLSYEHDAQMDPSGGKSFAELGWRCLSQRAFGSIGLSLFRKEEL